MEVGRSRETGGPSRSCAIAEELIACRDSSRGSGKRRIAGPTEDVVRPLSRTKRVESEHEPGWQRDGP